MILVVEKYLQGITFALRAEEDDKKNLSTALMSADEAIRMTAGMAVGNPWSMDDNECGQLSVTLSCNEPNKKSWTLLVGEYMFELHEFHVQAIYDFVGTRRIETLTFNGVGS